MAGFAKEGFNMYYPPEWRPECGDLDKFHGGHKLRDQVNLLSFSLTVPYSLKTKTKNSFLGKENRSRNFGRSNWVALSDLVSRLSAKVCNGCALHCRKVYGGQVSVDADLQVQNEMPHVPPNARNANRSEKFRVSVRFRKHIKTKAIYILRDHFFWLTFDSDVIETNGQRHWNPCIRLSIQIFNLEVHRPPDRKLGHFLGLGQSGASTMSHTEWVNPNYMSYDVILFTPSFEL